MVKHKIYILHYVKIFFIPIVIV